MKRAQPQQQLERLGRRAEQKWQGSEAAHDMLVGMAMPVSETLGGGTTLTRSISASNAKYSNAADVVKKQ